MNNYIEVNGIGYEYDELDGTIEVDKDGEILGHIYADCGEWELIQNGADPIKEEWEDGIGNVIGLGGWGNYKKRKKSVEINGILYNYIEDEEMIEVSRDGKMLGYVYDIVIDFWEEILGGKDLIKEGYEDGLGNKLSLNGWGI